MRNLVWIVLAAAAIGTPALAAEREEAQIYRVVGVADGDTLTAVNGKRQIKCRLYGIDAPEKKQAFGQASKMSLAQLSFGRNASIEVVDRDRYGRAVCKINVAGVDINKEQIARGMAWMYRSYTKDRDYSDAEMAAQSRRAGLWLEPEPTPPWAFRRSRRKT